MDKQISELFAAPIGIKPAYETFGTTFYSSDKLKENFILAFYKSSKGKKVADQVKNLVEKGIIIPCFRSKNVLSFIKTKLTKNADKYIAAFYNIDDKKVIVLIDNNSTIFGTASNNTLVSTTMHECMHLAAGRNLNEFLGVFGNYLRKYYSNFFMDYLDLKNVNSKDIDKIILYLKDCEKRGPLYANKNLATFYRLLEESFINYTNLDIRDFKDRLTSLVVACKLFVLSMSTLIQKASNFSMLFTALNRSYAQSFGDNNIYTMPIQELIGISEVACVFSEMKSNDSVVTKIFSIIK